MIGRIEVHVAGGPLQAIGGWLVAWMPDWLTVSLVVSVVGVTVGLRQLWRTRKAAEAAEEASQATFGAVERTLLLVDLGDALQQLEETKGHLRYRRFESALMRATDFTESFLQLREHDAVRLNHARHFGHLRILRKTLETWMQDRKHKIDVQVTIEHLTELSDKLNEIKGQQRLKETSP